MYIYCMYAKKEFYIPISEYRLNSLFCKEKFFSLLNFFIYPFIIFLLLYVYLLYRVNFISIDLFIWEKYQLVK